MAAGAPSVEQLQQHGTLTADRTGTYLRTVDVEAAEFRDVAMPSARHRGLFGDWLGNSAMPLGSGHRQCDGRCRDHDPAESLAKLSLDTCMTTVSLLEAQASLSKLVQAVEDGREAEVSISRHRRPVARLVPIRPNPTAKRLGVTKGHFVIPADIDATNAELAALFDIS